MSLTAPASAPQTFDIAYGVALSSPASPPWLAYEPLPALRSSGGQGDDSLADCQGKRIGVLIVSYNAVTTLPKVLKRIKPNVWQNVEEIAIFDDASQDETYELAVGMKVIRSLPKLTVLKHRQNLGYGGNQKAGYRYFMEKGFDIVVLLHGDGQYAPEILSHLYHPLVTGEADAVFGSRMMKGYGGPLKGGMPLYKYLGNRILSVLENRALGLNLTEFHSGYRSYNLQALRKIDFSKMTDDYHFDTEIIIKLHHQHYGIKEVPIPTYYGSELCHLNGLKYARNVMRSLRHYRRTCCSLSCYPEFREYFVHYPLKQSKYSSHYYLRQMTGPSCEILDLGCGEGFLAQELTKEGNRVTGVDEVPAAGQSSAMERYLQADLDQGLAPVIEQLHGKCFDRVLLLDIIEHLKSPQHILRECRDLLQRNGTLVVSVPNVANITVRLMLLIGRFSYTERGILDKTHLQFFTRKTIRQLLERCGYQVLLERATVIPLDQALGIEAHESFARAATFFLSWLTKALPGLFGYQIMLVAKAAGDPQNIGRGASIPDP